MKCKEGQYFCHDRGKCMPIPKGHKVRKDGELVKEVAPPGWGHTKAEKEKTKPDKPKSKIGGTAAAFKRALDDGRFKGLPGDKTYKDKKASMFKLMWSMKKKGDKPHYKPGTDEKYKKYQEETSMPNVNSKDRKYIKARAKNTFKKDLKGNLGGVNESLSTKDAKKLEKASVLSYSDDPKKQDRARARQVEIDYKDLLRQMKKVKKEELTFEGWKEKAVDAIKKVAGKKEAPKHEYPGRDAGEEYRKKLRKKDHETVNFLDPDD